MQYLPVIHRRFDVTSNVLIVEASGSIVVDVVYTHTPLSRLFLWASKALYSSLKAGKPRSENTFPNRPVRSTYEQLLWMNFNPLSHAISTCPQSSNDAACCSVRPNRSLVDSTNPSTRRRISRQ